MIGRAIPFLLALVVQPHELPDGHVERWCQIIVRDDWITVQYAVGYNGATADECLQAILDTTDIAAPEGADDAIAALEACLNEYGRQQLQLQCNGVALQPAEVTVRQSFRHPMCLDVQMEFATPTGVERVDIQFSDRCFATLPGAARYALRSKSSWELSDSNVAPLIVRATSMEIVAGEPQQVVGEIKGVLTAATTAAKEND